MQTEIYRNQEILAILDPLASLYQAVFQTDDKTRDLLILRIENSIRGQKNPIVITYSLHHEIVGAVFGFDYLPENYWAKNVHAHLPTNRDWFKSSFEINELFVREKYQGQGIGGKLLDSLMNLVPHDYLLLSTRTFDNDKALQFYKKKHFKVLVEQLRFENSDIDYSILWH